MGTCSLNAHLLKTSAGVLACCVASRLCALLSRCMLCVLCAAVEPQSACRSTQQSSALWQLQLVCMAGQQPASVSFCWGPVDYPQRVWEGGCRWLRVETHVPHSKFSGKVNFTSSSPMICAVGVYMQVPRWTDMAGLQLVLQGVTCKAPSHTCQLCLLVSALPDWCYTHSWLGLWAESRRGAVGQLSRSLSEPLLLHYTRLSIPCLWWA